MYAGFEVLQPGGGFAPFAVPDGVSNWSGTYSLTTPVFQRFNASVSVSYGGTPIYAEASDGRQLRTTASLTLRPTAVDAHRGQPGGHAHHPGARRIRIRAVDDPAR